MNDDSLILQSLHFNINKLINSFPASELKFGSEFRPWFILEPVLKHRTNWDRIKSFLQKGFTTSFNPSCDDQRMKDNCEALRRGNHKSALNHPDILRENIEKDVKYGY